MANPTELVIFDCDGVLVDSEVITMRTIIASCADLGLALDMAEAEEMFTGGHWAVVLAEIERRLGGRVPETFTADFRSRLVQALDEEVEPVEGIIETLEAMTHARCVASNGPHAKMEATLGRCGLLPYFEGRVFSAYDIDRFKPDPGLFLHAAEICGADPSRCVVVEDSMNGVRASEAAGMRTIAYVSKGDGETLRAAGATILRDMRKLGELL